MVVRRGRLTRAERFARYQRDAFGRRLLLLHRYNAWSALALLVTGAALYFPELRAVTAPVRTPLKQLHIWLGAAQIALLLAYLPMVSAHWRQAGPRAGQKLNIVTGVAAVALWGLSGVILWLERSAPAGWSETALVVHDAVTLGVLPWAIAHGILRWFGFRLPLPAWLLGVVNPVRAAAVQEEWRRTRRRALALAGRAAALLGAAALFGRAVRAPGRGLAGDPDGLGVALASAPHAEGAVPQPPATAERGVIGGGRSGTFRIYTVTDGFPEFNAETWRFRVGGLVNKPLAFTWDEFRRLPRHAQVSDFHCVTGWSVRNCTWEGVKLSHLLDLAGVKPEGRFVKFYSGDGLYTDALSLEDARDDDVMVAFLLDARQLTIANGGPARLIVPRMYGYKSVKWLEGLAVIDQPHVGFWEQRGYDVDAWVDPRKQRR